ncbi:hypothetical protein D915_002767 [Fasciola hepatica]|uniref:G-protein coupled receptors family 1 profile domain-containing protein n=1 Tax=Fasciola hepatica TaxID=6192 RepID=A0A4E0RXF2_FASHE|nr:hypothetical protein D915_002767 [Fasciola hepatica]
MNAVSVALAFVGVLGTALNLTMFCVLFRVKIGSRMTVVHLRCQSLVDAYLCFITFLYKVVGASIVTGMPQLDAFFCVLWYQDSLIWLGVIMSMLNTACVSLDRFLAVFFPVAYKIRQMRMLCFTFSYIITNTLLVFTPNLLRRSYLNGTCTYDDQHYGTFIESYLRNDAYLWLVFIYIIPISFIATSHASIVYSLTKRMHSNGTVSVMGRNAPMGRLTLSTIIMGSILVLGHAYDMITYMLNSFNVFQYRYLSSTQQLGVLFIVLSSCLSPCVLTGFNHPIQVFLKSRIILCSNLWTKYSRSMNEPTKNVFTLSSTRQDTR